MPNQTAENSHDTVAPNYDAFFSTAKDRVEDAFLSDEIGLRVCPIVMRLGARDPGPFVVPPVGLNVLDVGCGTGAVLDLLARNGIPVEEYVGIDSSLPMLEVCLEKILDHVESPSGCFSINGRNRRDETPYRLIHGSFDDAHSWDRASTETETPEGGHIGRYHLVTAIYSPSYSREIASFMLLSGAAVAPGGWFVGTFFGRFSHPDSLYGKDADSTTRIISPAEAMSYATIAGLVDVSACGFGFHRGSLLSRLPYPVQSVVHAAAVRFFGRSRPSRFEFFVVCGRKETLREKADRRRENLGRSILLEGGSLCAEEVSKS